MKKHIIAAAGLAIALGLAGCSSSGSETAGGSSAEVETAPSETKATPTENVDKTWTFDYQGATGTFTLNGDTTDAAVAPIEAARASVDGEPITLVPVTLDNTNGTETLNMYGLTVITKDGEQIDSVPLEDAFSEWEDAAGDDVEKYNALIDAYNEHALLELQPGAKGTGVVAFKQPIDSAWRVTVMPASGMEQVEAAAA
ncbi:hypothetical protein KK103_12020 [Curtobacterium flaccumfaciens pv. flaccumfaciens]|uniref:DUF4352 domain-containing protein n=1 Tax=Curtobacterium flaccumfaciens pv. flaccumfaciens TaxID=138532 RepID=A0A9Q2W344_9MICO|nr:hypothetical protein [Curtobacterium flaccumfaciens]MBT1542492.1 hypothetical protein [Curtobacterium flaccumfaciens pv. flaccumfaciens]